MQQAIDGVATYQHCAGPDKQGLTQTGKGFGLAVAVTMILISRPQGVVHSNQVEQ